MHFTLAGMVPTSKVSVLDLLTLQPGQDPKQHHYVDKTAPDAPPTL